MTLVGANLLFTAIAGALFARPDLGAAIYPAFGLIFFWTDFRLDEELHVLFLFMATAAVLVLMSRSGGNSLRLCYAVEAASVWSISFGLGFHRNRLGTQRQQALGLLKSLDGEVQNLDRDLRFYGAFETTAAAQILLRRDLTVAAKSIGATMDARQVQLRLIQALESRYPGCSARILPGQPPDALMAWAVSTRASVLVKDMQADERFRSGGPYAFRSAVAAALMVMKRPYGFLRLESDKAGHFTNDDLRTVDLFSTLASLSLENIQFFENVNDLATHDALTQLHTRKAFDNRLREEILRAGRSQTPLSLIMCDVDHFKKYNDSFGHQAGDMLLQKVAGLLSSHARPVDFTARYGGEEFCLVLPSIVRSQAVELADRIRMKIAEEPFLFQGQRTKVTMSFGVSSFPQDATTESQLIRAADERLYQAKHGGRNQVVG